MGRGSWVMGRGSWVVGRGSWVVGRGSCFFFNVNKRYIYIYIYIYKCISILAPSVLGPNLQLPAHELISPVARSYVILTTN